MKDTSALDVQTMARKWNTAKQRDVDALASYLAGCATAQDVPIMQRTALEALYETWGYGASTFMLATTAGPEINVTGGVVHGLPLDSLTTYLASYASSDVFAGRRARLLLSDRGIVDLSEIGPAGTPDERAYVRQFMEPMGIRSQLSTRVDTGSHVQAYLSIMSSERNAFDERDRFVLRTMGAIVAPFLSALILAGRDVTAEAGDLSPREREVAILVASGIANAAIASNLCVGIDTVKKHLASAFRKLGVVNRTQLTLRIRQMPSQSGY